MKKLFSVLMVLCLLYTAAAALAETVITMDDMAAVVIEGDDTTVELSAFNGTWVADKTFVGETYVDAETLTATYGLTIPQVRIDEGNIFYNVTDENGELTEQTYACTFEAGQLQSTDDNGINFCFDTLVDGNIVMSIFLAGDSDEVICVSIYMVRAE